MNRLTVATLVPAQLTWDYAARADEIVKLYRQATAAQWRADDAIDWSRQVDFGSPLPDDSRFALAAFEQSPLRRHGRASWDRFRWEFQAWLVSQFLHGEQGALVATARLAEVLPDIESKCYAASQVADEARHVDVFSRYLAEKIPTRYPVSPPFASLLGDVLRDSRWDVTTLGMQIIAEGLAMAAFRLGEASFHDPLILEITRLVARDEARHIAFGTLALAGIYEQMSAAELAEREEFVLEAAHLTLRRFLLHDIWERMGVDVDEGARFAEGNEMMIKYRQALFAKVVSALKRIGLMTDSLRDGFGKLGLVEFGHLLR
jgi:hypothetical protein